MYRLSLPCSSEKKSQSGSICWEGKHAHFMGQVPVNTPFSASIGRRMTPFSAMFNPRTPYDPYLNVASPNNRGSSESFILLNTS